MMKRRWLSLLVACSLTVGMCGCASATTTPTADSKDSGIELVEPVNGESSYDVVKRRNLYDANIMVGTVAPYVVEYSTDVPISFKGYGAYPGEQVKQGTILVDSNTKDLDEQIKGKQEAITNMDKEFLEYMSDSAEALKEQLDAANYWKYFVDRNEEKKPPEMIDASKLKDNEGQEGMVTNPAYTAWVQECGWVVGEYKIAQHQVDITNLERKQRTDLYNLDRAYAVKEKAQLEKKRKEQVIVAGMDGEVVAMHWYNPNDYIDKKTAVAAIGDSSQKLLKCDYIRKVDVSKATDLYALINGKRYEIEYQPMETDEYKRLEEENGKVYSTFTIQNAEDVEMGAFAVINLVKDSRNNVLTVPSSTINKNELGHFVYKVEDGKNVVTQVTVGMSDNVYTEIVEGLSEGDKVLISESKKAAGKERTKLAYSDFGKEYEERGMMFYPANYFVTNPVEYGTTYFLNYEVVDYQHVNKGDVIATVRVDGDNISLAGNEKKKSRIQSRIADLEAKDAATEDHPNAKRIQQYREELAELDKVIAKQRKDSSTKQIVADRSGIVIWHENFKQEDIIPFEGEIVEISDEATCYVAVQDEKQLLQYGNKVTVTYEDDAKQKKQVEGVVANVSKVAIGSNLKNDFTLILLPQEEIGNMSQTADPGDNWWSRFRYNVTGTVRKMEHVIVIPKKAVWVSNSQTYVNVIDENGEPKEQSFVAGGFDDKYYWVVEGLTEGMEVCLE